MGTLRTSRSALTCTTDFVGSGSCGAATGVIIQGSARQPAALRGNAPSCSVCLAGGADGQTPSVTRLGSPARETGSRVDGRSSAALESEPQRSLTQWIKSRPLYDRLYALYENSRGARAKSSVHPQVPYRHGRVRAGPVSLVRRIPFVRACAGFRRLKKKWAPSPRRDI